MVLFFILFFFFFSVEQVATLPIWRQQAFVISVKHQPATSIAFPEICCIGISTWLLTGFTCMCFWSLSHPGDPDSYTSYWWISFKTGYNHVSPPGTQAGLSAGKLSFPITDKVIWERREIFPPARGRKPDAVSSIVVSSVQ